MSKPFSQRPNTPYLMSAKTHVQVGHPCGPGRWYHALSANRSPAAIAEMLDRYRAHLSTCPGAYPDDADLAVLQQRLALLGHSVETCDG